MDNGWDLWLSYSGFTISYSVTGSTQVSHYPLHMKWVSMQPRLQWDHSQRQRVASKLTCRISAAVWLKSFKPPRNWGAQALGSHCWWHWQACVYESPTFWEHRSICTACCKVSILLDPPGYLKGLRGPLLKAFVLLTFRHVFGKCDFMNSVSVSVQTVLLFKCIFTVNPLPNLREKENHN